METKIVTPEEKSELFKLSINNDHPYYYRFRYSIKKKNILATRVKKESLILLSERKNFHFVDVDDDSPLGNAINKIENIKSYIGAFTYARN
jgi:hypothetical protein